MEGGREREREREKTSCPFPLFLCISGLSHIHNLPIAVCLPAVLDNERHMYSS
jgi:hypothetical protein